MDQLRNGFWVGWRRPLLSRCALPLTGVPLLCLAFVPLGGQVSWGRRTWEAIQGYLLAGNIIKEKWVLDHLLVFPLNPVLFHFTKWFSNPICDVPVSRR